MKHYQEKQTILLKKQYKVIIDSIYYNIRIYYLSIKTKILLI